MWTTNKRGLALYIFLALFILLGLGIYYGYGLYINHYYITFYDHPKNKYLDVPPFAERITSPKLELLGECDIRFATIDEQVANFFLSTSSKHGFHYEKKGKDTNSSFEITVKKDYVIYGSFEGNILKLKWTPVLTPNLQMKARKVKR
jgi:hypothetical protein